MHGRGFDAESGQVKKHTAISRFCKQPRAEPSMRRRPPGASCLRKMSLTIAAWWAKKKKD
jgi:hypothetical protein